MLSLDRIFRRRPRLFRVLTPISGNTFQNQAVHSTFIFQTVSFEAPSIDCTVVRIYPFHLLTGRTGRTLVEQSFVVLPIYSWIWTFSSSFQVLLVINLIINQDSCSNQPEPRSPWRHLPAWPRYWTRGSNQHCSCSASAQYRIDRRVNQMLMISTGVELNRAKRRWNPSVARIFPKLNHFQVNTEATS